MSANSPESIVAVFERRPYWGPELQRQFDRNRVTICECRAVGDLLPSITGFGAALLVIDLDSALTDCLTWLGANRMNNSNRCPIIACGSAETVELEWLLREAGVTAFLPDVVPGDEFARLCRWQLGLVQRRTVTRDTGAM